MTRKDQLLKVSLYIDRFVKNFNRFLNHQTDIKNLMAFIRCEEEQIM
jgi:hypothetical protein